MNKSSSFYSQAYYEKARKQAYKKKAVYRERHKELYDQQQELEIHHYYHNPAQRCAMLTYYTRLSQLYTQMSQQVIKNNEAYTICVEQFIEDVKKSMQYFHEHLMPRPCLTRQQYIALGLHSMEQLHEYWLKQNQKQELGSRMEVKREEDNRLMTCNLCPIFIEEFEFNFEKTLNLITRSYEYWDQLNGHQKISKYRSYVQQNLNVLKHQLQNKCQYARSSPTNTTYQNPRHKHR